MFRVQAVISVMLFAGHAKKRYRCALSIQIGTCLKSYLHGSISLEMILNCYCSCRYTLGSTDWAYVTQEYYQAGEGVGKQNVRVYLQHSGTLPLQSSSLSSDEESESEEITICTQSQDETLPSRPQMTFSMYTQGSKG